MTAGIRKLASTAHIVVSLGWLGAVVGTLALAVTGLITEDGQTERGAYLAMEAIRWWALVPSLASLLTGLIQARGTTWGLFRHCWVLVKLLANLAASGVLLIYMQTLGHLAVLARATSDSGAPRSLSRAIHAGAALLLLIGATVLCVYKPRARATGGQS